MESVLNFIFTFLLVYILYYFLSVRKAKRNSKKVPVEVEYLILLYKLDTKNFNYQKFVNTVALVGSLDIALVATIVFNIDGFLWELLFGFIFLVPVIGISYMLLGKYYKNLVEENVLEKKREQEEKERLKEEKKNKKKKNSQKDKKTKNKGERKNG